MITRTEAQEILDAFGPLSNLETCWTADEVVAAVNAAASPRAFIEANVVAEDVMGDRMAATAREQEASGEECFRDQHLHVVADEVEFLKLIKDRTTALMARKGW